ncbi:hypothetical protein DL764_003200 [Monosporascus ibericus]|uniref:Uncharacterized protein n=1 Tax=Monosporascus ibericus TaxID=155417 RepID=A0A4Q4THG7_9PEZI|nr:hypothetical protein DL764_003200 [Monosporascus ibericus]
MPPVRPELEARAMIPWTVDQVDAVRVTRRGGDHFKLTFNGITIKLDPVNLQATNYKLVCGDFIIKLEDCGCLNRLPRLCAPGVQALLKALSR